MLGIFMSLFAAFSASTHFSLSNYGISAAASNSTASASYALESSTGEVVAQTTSSTNYGDKSGSLQAQQASVPPAPTLSNGSGAFYNKLTVIVNASANPTDTTFAIAVSSNGFTSTSYVQIDGSLGSTPLYQTYTQWGGASGTAIVGLTSGTAYEAKVSAMQGKFTASAYGPFASASTVSSTLSYSLSLNSLTMPTLLSGTVEMSPTIGTSLTTNAYFGAAIYVSDQYGGLKSSSRSYTITSASGNLSSASEGYGLQSTGATQTSGGPLVASSPFNVTSNNVGILSTTPQFLYTTASAISGGSGSAVLLAKTAVTDPSATDYGDTLTLVAAANY